LIDAYTVLSESDSALFPRPAGSAAVLAILTFQALAAIYASVSDWERPFSDAKEVSSWLRQHGLDRNPLIVDFRGVAVVGYLERPSAFFFKSECLGSYAVWNNKFNPEKELSLDDLKAARADSSLPVILVYTRLNVVDAQKLGLIEIHSGAPDAIEQDEVFTVYEQEHP